MATINFPSAIVELPENHVQELSKNGDGIVLQRYIYKNTDLSLDASPMDCPTIDLELLGSFSEPELDKFRTALSSWGCFQIVNHGMSSSSLEEMRRVMKQFFDLPLEEKHEYSRAIDDLEGYGADTFVSENHVLDWTDRMYLMIYPVEKRRMKFWPEKPDTFRENLHEFALKMQEMLKLMLKAMARSLDVEDMSFMKQYGEGSIFARLNMYPRCSIPDKVLGIHSHTDGSAMTFVLQDKQVEGLQVLKDGRWFKVPVNPNALFVNVGDQLEIMSNGIFKSPTHRVVTNSEHERISMAVFCSPDADNEIGPLEKLITEDRPQMYKTVKNYVTVFTKAYQHGEAPLSGSALRI